MIKARKDGGDPSVKLGAGQHLLASAESGICDLTRSRDGNVKLTTTCSAGIITAVMTNPLWVVKTRMFTSTPGSPGAYKNVFRAAPPLNCLERSLNLGTTSTDGVSQLARQEGLRGLSKGMALALFGVSNGAIQFMTYEELKRWRIDDRRRMLGEEIGRAHV